MNIECYGHKGIARLHQHVPLGRAISSQLINFFSDLRALIANIPDKVVRWCPDGDFWVLHFQRTARSTFQTCIVNSQGHTICRSIW